MSSGFGKQETFLIECIAKTIYPPSRTQVFLCPLLIGPISYFTSPRSVTVCPPVSIFLHVFEDSEPLRLCFPTYSWLERTSKKCTAALTNLANDHRVQTAKRIHATYRRINECHWPNITYVLSQLLVTS